MMKRLIRQYEEKDLDAVLTAWESASRVAHPFLSQEFMQQERLNIPQLYLPQAETWVLEQDGQVIGFISLLGNEVGAIFVKPAFHGSGAGRALMDQAQRLYGELEVEVFKANMMGRNFYERYGFELLAEKMHEETGQELLRLKFSITPPT
jgi:putative acetyltransferase